MTKEFVNYSEALALRELGFDEPCICCYDNARLVHLLVNCTENDELIGCRISEFFDKYLIRAPTFSQIFKWFREKYKLGAIVSQFGWGIENEFGQIIYNIGDDKNPLCYEEAELECFKKLIEIAQKRI